VLVDIGRDPELPPADWIVPEWWMLNHIHVRHRTESPHTVAPGYATPTPSTFAIIPKNVGQWSDRWDLLGILLS
jgi:hypothetical protein